MQTFTFEKFVPSRQGIQTEPLIRINEKQIRFNKQLLDELGITEKDKLKVDIFVDRKQGVVGFKFGQSGALTFHSSAVQSQAFLKQYKIKADKAKYFPAHFPDDRSQVDCYLFLNGSAPVVAESATCNGSGGQSKQAKEDVTPPAEDSGGYLELTDTGDGLELTHVPGKGEATETRNLEQIEPPVAPSIEEIVPPAPQEPVLPTPPPAAVTKPAATLEQAQDRKADDPANVSRVESNDQPISKPVKTLSEGRDTEYANRANQSLFDRMAALLTEENPLSDKAKYRPEDAIQMAKFTAEGGEVQEIADSLRLPYQTVYAFVNGRGGKHVENLKKLTPFEQKEYLRILLGRLKGVAVMP